MANPDVFPLGDVVLQSGATLWQAKLAYKTYGTLNAARDNVVLIPTFYAGHHTDVEAMMAAGRAIDPAKYFVIVPNMFGNGLSSSPSNTPPPIDRAAFPRADALRQRRRPSTASSPSTSASRASGWSRASRWARSRPFSGAPSTPTWCAAIAPICGTARTSPHNFVFLEGVKAALTADAAFEDGWYRSPPMKGLIAFARVYAGWVYSQDFYREREYRKMGLASIDDVLRFSEARYRQRDANDLLAMLWTWQHADISANPRFNGDIHGGARGDHGARDRDAGRDRPVLSRARQRARGPRTCRTRSCDPSRPSGDTRPAAAPTCPTISSSTLR